MYEVFDHTADLGLRIEAADPAELLVEAARGLISVLVANPEDIRAVQTQAIVVEGNELDYLLFDWLTEILYQFSSRRLVFRDFELTLTDHGLTAICHGEPLDFDRHRAEHEVKAITYHGLTVEHRRDRWTAEIIVDI